MAIALVQRLICSQPLFIRHIVLVVVLAEQLQEGFFFRRELRNISPICPFFFTGKKVPDSGAGVLRAELPQLREQFFCLPKLEYAAVSYKAAFFFFFLALRHRFFKRGDIRQQAFERFEEVTVFVVCKTPPVTKVWVTVVFVKVIHADNSPAWLH